MRIEKEERPRPYFNSSYTELKERFRELTENYLKSLLELTYELDHRRVPWPIMLCSEIRTQIERVKQFLRGTMERLP